MYNYTMEKKIIKKKIVKKVPVKTPIKSVLAVPKQLKKLTKVDAETARRNALADEIEEKTMTVKLVEGEKEAAKPWLFQKGQSGNPSGRPKGKKTWATMVREAMVKKVNPVTGATAEEEIINNIIELAKRGNPKMIEIIWNYIDGKPNQPMDLNVEGGLDEEEREQLNALLAKNHNYEDNSKPQTT
jgi:hypothetical protein